LIRPILRGEAKNIENMNEENAVQKEKTIQDEINNAYQACCDASDEDTDFICTATPNPEPLQGMLFISKYSIQKKKITNIFLKL